VICELYTFRTSDEERTDIVKEFRKPDSYIRGLISVSALSKGFDVSDVEVIIMARPLKSSLAEHIQILGRGLRIHPGKFECIVLDHSGNCVRFWDAMHEFLECGVSVLDDGKKKEKKAAKKRDKEAIKCPKCYHVHDSAPSCPACGHVYPRKSSAIEHQEGSLSELNGSAVSKASMEQKRDWHGQLLSIAEERGYASGWVSHKYKEKFGVWPNGLESEPIPPTPAVMNWVRSRAIAFSKAAKHA
jgi:DNA repair protein RadD